MGRETDKDWAPARLVPARSEREDGRGWGVQGAQQAFAGDLSNTARLPAATTWRQTVVRSIEAEPIRCAARRRQHRRYSSARTAFLSSTMWMRLMPVPAAIAGSV
jgi:hypothetical protein